MEGLAPPGLLEQFPRVEPPLLPLLPLSTTPSRMAIQPAASTARMAKGKQNGVCGLGAGGWGG